MNFMVAHPSHDPKTLGFGAKLHGSEVSIPATLASMAISGGVSSPEDLVRLVLDHPRSIADAFGWKLDEAMMASEELIDEIRPLLDPCFHRSLTKFKSRSLQGFFGMRAASRAKDQDWVGHKYGQKFVVDRKERRVNRTSNRR